MISVSCHCGAIGFKVPNLPPDLGLCNCSACSKMGGLWGYYNPAEVEFNVPRENIDTYIWGDKTLQFCRCTHCGCLTHWESIDPDHTGRMGVNARMMEDIDLDKIPIRRIDGASF